MKNYIYSLLILSLLFACDQRPEQGENNQNDTTDIADTADNQIDTAQATSQISPRLKKVWETDTLMTTAESVLYDKKRNIIYVSNINGGPTDNDGNGFISTLDVKTGEILEAYYISGSLDAPKGMGISNGKLYVTNINELVEFDLETKVSSNRWRIDSAKFLNDVAVGKDGTVYFSDSQTNTIYTLKGNKIDVFLHNKELEGPNGLFIRDDKVIVATMNGSKFTEIDKKSKKLKVIAEQIGAGDGIAQVNDSSFIVSSWNGQVFQIDENGNKEILLDTQGDKINSADIEYIQEQNLLLVPTFFDNRVVAYKLSLTDTTSIN